MFIYLFILREGVSEERAETEKERERERERERESQAGSTPSAWSLMQGLNLRTVES